MGNAKSFLNDKFHGKSKDSHPSSRANRSDAVKEYQTRYMRRKGLEAYTRLTQDDRDSISIFRERRTHESKACAYCGEISKISVKKSIPYCTKYKCLHKHKAHLAKDRTKAYDGRIVGIGDVVFMPVGSMSISKMMEEGLPKLLKERKLRLAFNRKSKKLIQAINILEAAETNTDVTVHGYEFDF